MSSFFLVARTPRARHGDVFAPGKIIARDGLGVVHDLLRRALRDDLAAVDAGTRADIDDMIGGEDRVLVMLDDDHCIADVAQVLQRVEQAVVVALMQADGGFVQHVEHAGEARADLRGEPDALRFTAR